MSDLNTEHSKVYVIDLLSPQERSAWQISDNAEQFLSRRGVAVEQMPCDDKSALKAALKEIKRAVNENNQAIVHFVSHGNEMSLGWKHTKIALPWSELSSPLIAINEAQAGTLIVNITSCLGVYAVGIQALYDKACPFFGVIGPTRKLNYTEAIAANTYLYGYWLQDMPVIKCVEAVNRSMQEDIFWPRSSQVYKKRGMAGIPVQKR